MDYREIFEDWAVMEGLDISKHKSGFYLSPITYRSYKAFMEGVQSATP